MSDAVHGPGAAGLVLAAGAGRRMGRPKALLRDACGTPFVRIAVEALAAGGCSPTRVVVGALAREVARAVDDGAGDVTCVTAPGWKRGMGVSLVAGLRACAGLPREALVVHLVDLPDVGPQVVGRLLEAAGRSAPLEWALVRARYDGRPGHPVVVGRRHWSALAEACHGDVGGREYLSRNGCAGVECGDLASGRDIDTPAALAAILERVDAPTRSLGERPAGSAR